MKDHMPPVETRYQDLWGHISVNLKNKEGLSAALSKLTGFNPQRFEPVAIRVYFENALQFTLFAHDKDAPHTSGKMPVHKFKMDVAPSQLLELIKQMDFTLTTGNHDLDQMEVINK